MNKLFFIVDFIVEFALRYFFINVILAKTSI